MGGVIIAALRSLTADHGIKMAELADQFLQRKPQGTRLNQISTPAGECPRPWWGLSRRQNCVIDKLYSQSNDLIYKFTISDGLFT